MTPLAFLSPQSMATLAVFALIVAGTWLLLSAISDRNSQAEERLDRIGRPKSLVEMDLSGPSDSGAKFAGLKGLFGKIGAAAEDGQSELEKNALRLVLANAGYRSETAPAVFQGVRMVFLVGGVSLAGLIWFGMGKDGGVMRIVLAGMAGFVGLFGPKLGLEHLAKKRQKEIFLTLPDALDLLVVCVESGLGLDAALRKVTEEMKGHARTICEELTLANLQLQMGRPRREVLHDLGVRTGVDDVKALAAILIQADRFGASIGQALRVQSDSMRTRRRQIAEEKAAKTAVQLIFPLVLFIFPAIFVVLVGPASILIIENLINKK